MKNTVTRPGSRIGRAALAICLIATLLQSGAEPAHAVRVSSITVAFDEFGSGGVLHMQLENIAFPSKLFLERRVNLGSAPWVSEFDGTIVLTPELLFAVPLDETKSQEFFRFRSVPLTATGGEDVDGFSLNTTEETSLEDAFAVFFAKGEFVPYLVNPYDPEDVQKPGPPEKFLLPRGERFFHNFSELKVNGVPLIWAPPPGKDDAAFTRRYPATTDDQRTVDKSREVPGDGGTGNIDEGWNGDNIVERPVTVSTPPEPTGKEMVFDPEVSPAPEGEQDDRGVVTLGTHARLLFRFTREKIELEKGESMPNSGNGLGGGPPPMPGEGYVLVVRSQSQNTPGGIYHISPFLDPLEQRSYDPPTRGSHGEHRAEQGLARLRLPLLDENPQKALAGVTLQIYEVNEFAKLEQEDVLLTPEFFARNENAFTKVYETTGDSIIAILIGLRPTNPSAPVGTSTVTEVHRSGSNGSKFNFCIIGDGFSASAADQQAFRAYVTNVVLDLFRNQDVGPEIFNAVNIFRIDTVSQDSGMTIVNAAGNVTTARNTALEYRFSGIWQRCWMEAGPNSATIINGLVASLCPQADQIILVLNTASFGGCAGGNTLAVTRGANVSVLSHEIGHIFGQQGDEYQCNQGSAGCGSYTGSEPSRINLTIDTSRSTVEWSEWIPPWRPVPTTAAHVADTSEDVGIFPGGTMGSGQWWTGIYRPSFRGRMNNNAPPHNPVGYGAVRNRARSYQEATFRKNAVGDFDGDGLTDLVRLDGRQIALYLAEDRDLGPDDPVTGNATRSPSGVLEPTWFGTDFIVNAAKTRSWQARPGDKLLPGDFDGDGRMDLYIANTTDWSIPYLVLMRSVSNRFEPVARYDGNLPGWQMTAGDEFYVADHNGDGKDDLMIFNGKNWSIPYFILLRSQGSSLSYVRRYDQFLPVWEMGRHEKFITGDFNGDGSDDVIAFNTASWSQVHLQVQQSTGSGLTLSDRFYGTIPGIWQMRRQDKLYALDFNGDGTTDAAIFNGLEWGPVYLALLRGQRGDLTGVRRYDNVSNHLPGWQMQRRDRFWVANVNGDTRQDLVVYNKDNWNTQYLGMLRAGADNNLVGSWQDNWIGGWNLGPTDDFKVADYRGGANWDDLFVFNDNWFGLLRSYSSQYALDAIYLKWIHNHRYHKYGWW